MALCPDCRTVIPCHCHLRSSTVTDQTATPPTEQQLDEIAARANATRPGPWILSDDLEGDGYPGHLWVVRTPDSGPDEPDDQAVVISIGDRALGEFIAHARADVPLLLDTVRRQRARVAELEVGLNDLAALVSQWYDRAKKAEVRVADLEGPAVEARAALASLCYDLEDPGSAALGALYLISRATTGVEAPRDEAAQVLASHDAQIMRRCAEFVRDTYGGEWADDAAATLERDADVAERGCPGYEDAGRGDTEAERQLANCKHCGRPRVACLAASEATSALLAASHASSVSESAQSPTGAPEGPLGDSEALEPESPLPDRLEAVLTQRFTELGNPYSRMSINFQGPDGWPASKEVGPHDVAEVLRELLATPPRRTLTPNEYDAAWHAVEGAAGDEGADPGTVLHAVLNRLGIDTPPAEGSGR